MTYDAFWSFSLGDRATRLKVRELRATLHERYEVDSAQQKKPAGDFYVCELQGYTDDWRRNIREALKAPTFVALVDGTYLQKPYCFFEWLAYDHVWDADCTLIGQTRQSLGVIATLDLTNRGAEAVAIENPEELFERTRRKFDRAKNATAADAELWSSVFQGRYDWATTAGEEEIRDAIGRWAEALTKVQVAPVDPEDEHFGDKKSATDLVRSIRRARNAADEASAALEKFVPSLRPRLRGASQLALFCLAFDRFHDGGWGFSLEEDYLLDDDRQVLASGAHEVNLLAIRCLRSLLDRNTYADELYALVTRLEGDSRANLDVTDRKHRLTSVLVHLVGKNEIMLGTRVGSIVQEATAEDNLRWIVQEPHDADDASVFLYALCQKLGEASANRDLWHAIREQLHGRDDDFRQTLTDRQIVRLQKLATPYADQTFIADLFSTFIKAPHGRVSRSQLRRALQMSLLLSDREFAQRYSANFATVVRGRQRGEGAMLTTSALALLCLMLSDLLFHASGGVVSGKIQATETKSDLVKVRERFGLLWRELQERLSGPQMLTNLAGMNSVGWAAFLLMCEKQGVIEAASLEERERRSNDWNDGLELRRTMGKTVRRATAASDVRGDLLREVIGATSEVVARERNNLRDIDTDQLAEFADSLLSRGIIRQTGTEKSTDPELEQERERVRLLSHVGMLEVEKVEEKRRDEPSRTTLRVRSADDGYSKLFLEPFSERTSLRADNLNRMMRHFGGSDDDLVKNISDVVVVECYEILRDKLQIVDFEERTHDIIRSLTIGGGVAERDILKLHGVREGETVYVRRNATLSLQQEPDGKIRTFYRWIFSDMTIEWKLAQYQKLIDPPTPPAAIKQPG